MQITRNVFTIADLIKWLEEKKLIVNYDYQRGKGLWPLNARSYFIDTILNGFPFPKITIRQTIDLRTRESKREIVDGQQRMMTIHNFMENKFALSSVSESYGGKKFLDLDDEVRNNFLAYEISVDTLIAASKKVVLEIFSRINSYTIPLNEPEKRHALYQGEFKWFIKNMINLYMPTFETYGMLTLRQMARMLDADLMTELSQVLIKGVFTRSPRQLRLLYKDNDSVFKNKNIVKAKLIKTLDFIKSELNQVCEARVLKSYSLYSLFSALVYNKWGIIGIRSEDLNGFGVIGKYTTDVNTAVQNILELFLKVDQNDEKGKFGEFVKANLGTTHSLTNRKIRLKWLVAAIQGKM